MEKKQRTFTETEDLADFLADTIERIEKASLGSRFIGGKASRLRTVSNTMAIIAETPNASVNAETMQAFNLIVDEGMEALQNWARAFLTPAAELADWEIPF
jgi:hypothetical protein